MRALVVSLLLFQPVPAFAHPGGLNAEGCHNNRKTGDYHCHRPGSVQRAYEAPQRPSGVGYYPNCAAARSAGAAPVMAGEPGYGRHLDRDGDGIGCE
jgi:Excalibur calcium-binding domain